MSLVTLSTCNRSSERLFCRPTMNYSVFQRSDFNPNLLAPRNNVLCLAAKCQNVLLPESCVLCILSMSHKTTIAWSIISIHVSAINLQRFRPSVRHSPCSKRFKTALPFITYRNSSSSIMSIRSGPFTIAPRLHPAPDRIKFTTGHSVRCHCLLHGLLRSLHMETAARHCETSPKRCKPHRAFFRAIADTKKYASRRMVGVANRVAFLDDCQPSKFRSGVYNKLTGHDIAPKCCGLKKRRGATNTPSFRIIPVSHSGVQQCRS